MKGGVFGLQHLKLAQRNVDGPGWCPFVVKVKALDAGVHFSCVVLVGNEMAVAPCCSGQRKGSVGEKGHDAQRHASRCNRRKHFLNVEMVKYVLRMNAVLNVYELLWESSQ